MPVATKYTLIDFDQQLRDAGKGSWLKTKRKTVEKIVPGTAVKVGFVPEIKSRVEGEWMYVVVEKRLPSVPDKFIFSGKLDNLPVYCPSLKLGSYIEFEERHIYQVEGLQ